ncbi:MAG: SelL-related redox protein [Acidobacteriota bacterium]
MSSGRATSRWGAFGSLDEALKRYCVGAGETLYDASFRRPVMVVFLRHGGCTFCREALGDLASVRDRIAGTGTDLVVVQMGTPREGQELARRFGLVDAQVISDPSRNLYRAFELDRGTFRQVFGLRVWLRLLKAALLRGLGAGLPKGQDERQMPGVFLLRNGQIAEEFRHQTIADRPDYVALASLATTHDDPIPESPDTSSEPRLTEPRPLGTRN